MLSPSPGLSAEIRRVFDELDRGGATAGECVPPLDFFEADGAFVAVIDLPGVPSDAVRVLVKDNVLVVAGEKPAPACAAKEDARFHLAERTFGRFARAVRLPGPADAARASATLERGVLRVTIPRVAERRGAAIDIPIKRS